MTVEEEVVKIQKKLNKMSAAEDGSVSILNPDSTVFVYISLFPTR